MVIAFEGMDGCGKSTVAKAVAKKVGFNHETQRIINIMDIEDRAFSNLVKLSKDALEGKMPKEAKVAKKEVVKEEKKETVKKETAKKETTKKTTTKKTTTKKASK